MNNYLDEYSMRQASIFELRNIAREMGVNSPTIYKKEVLIEKILKIINGEEKPQMPKSRQGRPPKNLSNHKYVPTNVENVVSYKDLLKIQESSTDENKYDLNIPNTNGFGFLASPGFTYGVDSSKENKNPLSFEKEKGYFLLVDNEYGYIFEEGRTSNVENVIYVPENYINAYNIKSGDLIECGTKKVTSTNTKYLASVDSVNGLTEINHERLDFDNIKIKRDEGVLVHFDKDNSGNLNRMDSVYTGTRNVFLTTTLRFYSNFVDSFYNKETKEKENTVFVNLCLDALPEDVSLFENKPNFENFYTLLGDSDKQNNITVNLAVSRVKRLVELNKNVVFIVNEIRKIIKHQNFTLGYSAEEIKNNSLNNCYSILSLARKTELDNSVTVCSLLKTEEESNFINLLKNELDNMNCNFYNWIKDKLYIY